MITLHSGKHLLLQQDNALGLILDIKSVDKLTDAQVAKIDHLMFAAGNDSWYGHEHQLPEVMALVKEIDRPKEMWTSRAEESRARQQREGGR